MANIAIQETATFTLPAFFASYLVNGDPSVFFFDENGEEVAKKSIDDWLEREGLGACEDLSTSPSFTWHPDGPTDKGCDCLEFTFSVRR